MKTDSFGYELPEELIAQNPVYPRDACRLMVLDRGSGEIRHKIFGDLPSLLKKGDVLVLNKSKVIPARIIINVKGKEAEILITRRLKENVWGAMVRPGKFFKVDAKVKIDEDLEAQVKEICEDGQRIIEFSKGGKELDQKIKSIGCAPYPPYIKNTKASFEDYQTIYADQEGSIAAPTAGLHFTEKMISDLKDAGIQIEYVTLHVGLGTFLPIKADNIDEHKMHSEYYEMNKKTAQSLSKARNEGRRIIAVGTTAVRVLESNCKNGRFTAEKRETDIFIRPGYKWKCVDALITNFHLPKSTLILLVSSFAGKEFVFKAYREAIKRKYRFYSFGDAMLIQ